MWWIWAVAAVVVAVVVALVSIRSVRRRLVVVTVVGESMLPTYRTGDRVVVRRTDLAQVRPGDVVVIEEPDDGGGWVRRPPFGARATDLDSRQWMIKRVVAVPGDPAPVQDLPPMAAGPAVPVGAFVVRGDNANRSYDSRQLGYFPADRLLGVVARTVTG